jgi:hypothetical protein
MTTARGEICRAARVEAPREALVSILVDGAVPEFEVVDATAAIEIPDLLRKASNGADIARFFVGERRAA